MVQLEQTQFGGMQILSPTATNYDEVEKVLFDILSKGKSIRTAEDASKYMSELEDDCIMQPLHEEGNVIIIDQSYCALLWENPDHPNDPDYMAGVIFMLVNKDGENKFEPAAVIVGDKFEGVFQYRNGCCGGMSSNDKSSAYSMLIFIEQDGDIRHKTLDTPVTRQECLQKFAKLLPHGVKISSHDIKHMLHHHRHGHDHNCGHDHSTLPKPKRAQHP